MKSSASEPGLKHSLPRRRSLIAVGHAFLPFADYKWLTRSFNIIPVPSRVFHVNKWWPVPFKCLQVQAEATHQVTDLE